MAVLLPRRRNRVVVLCYHSVQANTAHTSVGPGQFADHLDWLTDQCDVVAFSEISGARPRGGGRPEVAITFDDGYLDNFGTALPLLLDRGLPATIFITTGLVDGDPQVVRYVERLWGAAPGEIKAMTWDQVAELAASGMEVGAHTVSHPNLADLSLDHARYEIQTSKSTIEDHLGVSVRTFAYPFGKPREHFDESTKLLVLEAGFEAAGSILYRGIRASDSPFAIPRIPITGDTTEALAAKIYGRLDLIGSWQERAPRWAARTLAIDVAAPD